jgi:hypothetical protein
MNRGGLVVVLERVVDREQHAVEPITSIVQRSGSGEKTSPTHSRWIAEARAESAARARASRRAPPGMTSHRSGSRQKP